MAEENITAVITIQEPIIQLTENGVEGFEILCRICANRNDHLIPIYSEEGVSNDLADKMNLYLPIKVSKSDTLPLQCCFQCASTVLTWHELVIASVEADRRLKEVQTEVEKQISEQNLQNDEPGPSLIENDDDGKESSENLSPVRQEITTPDDLKTEVIEPSTTKKRRGTKQQNIHFETSDGEWIKTEFVLETDVNSFISDLSNDTNPVKLDPLEIRDNSDSDFDDIEAKLENETKINLHSCDNCGKFFNKASNLRKHNCQKKKRELRCDYCQIVVFFKKEDLKNHIRIEHPDNFEQWAEKKMKQRSKIDQEAVNRAKIVVNSRTYYHCSLCGKNLHSPYTYIWHNRIHTGERPFVCDLCGKQFRVSQGLVRHLRETHAGIKNFPCDLCGRMFATRRNVEEHRRIHTNERPYICDLCGKSFKQKASLFVHSRSHTDSFPFKCTYCNQGFRTRPPLLVHVTKHTGEKPYACDICGRCFRIKYELKRHRLIHSDDKPFSCTDCGLSFRQKRYLRNHNKINHNKLTP